MSILQMSLQAGLLIVAIVMIRALALNRLPKQTFLVLWGVALARLLVPFSVSSRFSVYALVRPVIEGAISGATTPMIAPMATTPPAGVQPVEAFAAALPQTAASIDGIMVIWLAGMLLSVVVFAALIIKNQRILRFSVRVRSDAIDQWTDEHKLLRPLDILCSDRITTPIAAGIMRPRIVLPKTMDLHDNELLQYVLTHEYFHIRRFDAAWKLVMLAALCMHWFNPLVWVMFILANRDLEITCDEMVVKHFGANTKAAYAVSLISMAETRSRFTPLYNGFSKNSAEERITAIMKYKRTSMSAVALAVLLIFGMTTVFASTPNGDALVLQDAQANQSTYDAKIKAEDVLAFDREIIPCVDGVSAQHRTSQGQMAIYTNGEGAWRLAAGQMVGITFDTALVDGLESSGQGVWFGYIKDGEYVRCGNSPDVENHELLGETTLSFVAPQDGDYRFFMVNMSGEAIDVNSCTVGANSAYGAEDRLVEPTPQPSGAGALQPVRTPSGPIPTSEPMSQPQPSGAPQLPVKTPQPADAG